MGCRLAAQGRVRTWTTQCLTWYVGSSGTVGGTWVGTRERRAHAVAAGTGVG